MTRLANKLRPIEAAAAEELKAPVQSIIEFLDESARPEPGLRQARGTAGRATPPQARASTSFAAPAANNGPLKLQQKRDRA